MRSLRNMFLAEVLLLVISCSSNTPTAPTPPPTPPAPVVVTPQTDPPALSCPAPVTTNTTAAAGATVSYTVPSATGGQSPTSVECTPPSGGTFAVGTTEVRCTATDGLNRTASCSFGVTVSRTFTISKTKFVAFGDSITEGWTATTNPSGTPPYNLSLISNQSYPTVLRQMLASRYPSQTITVINHGKGGEKAVDGVSRAGSVFNAERPDAALILDGYNDLGVGEAGIDSAIAAINEIVKDARFRGARVFVGTLTPPPTNVNKGIARSTIDRFNARLKDMARGENAVLVDVNAYYSVDPNRFNSDDGRHPNEAGYRVIAQAFFDAIQREFEVR